MTGDQPHDFRDEIADFHLRVSAVFCVYADPMILLKMMLRLFTTIFGITHPSKEEEDKYAWMLFGLIVVTVAAMAAVAWIVVKMMG